MDGMRALRRCHEQIDPARFTLVRQLLVVFGLSGVAIAQPMLSLLGGNPTFFAYHSVTGSDLFWYAVVLVVVPPLILWIPGAFTRLVAPSWAWVPHVITAAVLVGCLAVQLSGAVGLEGRAVQLLVGGLAAVGFGVLYVQHRAVGQWGALLAVVPVLALAQFVWWSPTSDLISVEDPALAAGGSSDTPVFMLVIDELPTLSVLDPDGEIDRVRFPNLAAFADDSTWYPNYSTVAPMTDFAIPSVLTGQDPRPVDPIFANYPDSLYTALAPTHHLVAFESVTHLCGFSRCTEAPPGESGTQAPRYGELTDRVSQLWLDRVVPGRDDSIGPEEFAEEIEPVAVETSGDDNPFEVFDEEHSSGATRVDELLATVRPGETAFYYLHLLLPHFPFVFDAEGTRYQVDPKRAAKYPKFTELNEPDWRAALAEQRHLQQAMFTDVLVGQLMDGLRELGVYDESLIVVVSDHGATFEPGQPFRWLTEDSAYSVMHGPLLIKRPGQTGASVDHANVMAIDIAPTVADIIGVELPYEVRGLSVDHPAIADRGSTKYGFDVRTSFEGPPSWADEIVYFDVEEEPPRNERQIGPMSPNEDPIDGLHRVAGIDHLVGRPLDEVLTSTGSGAEVQAHNLDEIEDPGESPVGVVEGVFGDPVDGDGVLIAVDGVIVSGSPLFAFDGEDGLFAALLPSEALRPIDDLRIALLRGREVAELAIAAS